MAFCRNHIMEYPCYGILTKMPFLRVLELPFARRAKVCNLEWGYCYSTMALCPPGKKSCSDVIRASWNEEKDEFLVSQLQIQSDRGKRADSGFKKEAWRSVTTAFNEQFAVVYLPAQLKSRLDTVRKGCVLCVLFK
uniref:Myb/SANT-like domain-containing protein n=1 Tax=Spongospora subterranea TaxID=70186 RepID=A0A0H5QVT6_9EUKA|eukprot:CRZ05834.1 hypothetical protein [Spongospora subterranea]